MDSGRAVRLLKCVPGRTLLGGRTGLGEGGGKGSSLPDPAEATDGPRFRSGSCRTRHRQTRCCCGFETVEERRAEEADRLGREGLLSSNGRRREEEEEEVGEEDVVMMERRRRRRKRRRGRGKGGVEEEEEEEERRRLWCISNVFLVEESGVGAGAVEARTGVCSPAKVDPGDKGAEEIRRFGWVNSFLYGALSLCSLGT